MSFVIAERQLNKSTRTGKDLERINWQGLSVSALNFNYSHLVAVDREVKVRVAGDRNQAESVAYVARKVKIYPEIEWIKY